MELQILVAHGSNWAFALEEPLEVGPNVVRPFRLRFNGTNETLQSRCVQPHRPRISKSFPSEGLERF